MQTFLAHLRELDAGVRDAVLAEVGVATVDAVDGDPGFFAWLPVEANMSATRAVARRLGPRRTHDFFVALQERTLSTPLFDWVQRKADFLLGQDPTRRLRWVAKGYAAMFSDAGTWRPSRAATTRRRSRWWACRRRCSPSASGSTASRARCTRSFRAARRRRR